MDKRSLRNKRGKHHTSRTHERPNQGILGRVASKVKGILNPWFFNVWNSASAEEPGCSTDYQEEPTQEREFVPQTILQSSKRPRLRVHDHSPPGCSGNTLSEPSQESDFVPQTSSRGIKRLRLHEHSIPGCSTDVFNERQQEQDYASQNSTLGGKRQRLMLPDHNPSILSAGTQTWLEVPDRPNLFGQTSHVPSSNVQHSLIGNKDSSVMMNGDDHSENSEGSASTSGCSSLVSHKDRANCISSIILGESEIKSRRDAASQKELSGDISSNRLSLWSTGVNPASRSIRSPSVMQSSQPGFSVSAFVGSSKLADRKVSSPFYQGRTTFGGASASRRMPIAAAPYQTDKPLRNQIKFRSNEPKDSYEGMSSAAKRILQTLEKMSSPVTDAKKIPNTNKSPVDLSLYLMPPKHRRNLQSTPAGPTKGPPIADISTISKLTTIKSYSHRSFQNTLLESPTLLREDPTPTNTNVLSQAVQSSAASPSLPSGGGKMKNKLNQQHQPSARSKFGAKVSEIESRMSEYIDAMGDTADLPEIPLPITSLPTITFGSSLVKASNDSRQSGKDFVFSNPIEHVVPNVALSSLSPSITNNFLPQLSTTATNRSDNSFTFSNPIELENPISSAPAASMMGLSSSTAKPLTSWECSSCWVPNPAKETKCLCCEAPNPNKGNTTGNLSPAPLVPSIKTSFENLSSSKKTSSTWECSSCWVRNPADKDKCLACEEPNPSRGKSSVTDQSSATHSTLNKQELSSSATIQLTATGSGFKFNVPSESSKSSGFKFGLSSAADKDTPLTASSGTVGFKLPEVSTGSTAQAASFGGFTIPINNQCKVESKSNNSTTSDDSNKKDFSARTTTSINKVNNHLKERTVSTSSVSPLSKTVTNSVSHSSEKEKKDSAFSFVSNSPLHSSTAFFGKKLVPEISSKWECDVCLVRNDIDKQKCVACESLRPNKNLSGFSFKHTNDKISSPDSASAVLPVTSISVPASTAVTSSTAISTSSAETSSCISGTVTVPTSSSVMLTASSGSETTTTASFSSGSVAASKLETSSAVSSPMFQFGSNSPGNIVPASTSESTNSNFSFGAKSSTANPLLAPSSQTSLPSVGGNSLSQTVFKSPTAQPTFGKSTDKPALGGFNFSTGSSSTASATTAPVFQFGSTTPAVTSSWECSGCQSKNNADKQKCGSCGASRPEKTLSETLSSKPPAISSLQTSSISSTPAPTFQFSQSSTTNTASVSTASTAVKFSFGTKSESTNPLLVSTTQAPSSSAGSIPTQTIFGSSSVASAFGNPASKASSGGFSFAAAPTTATSLFQFGSKAPIDGSSQECSSCQGKSDGDKQKCTACHAGKNVPDSTTSKSLSITGFQTSAAATSAPVFQFGSQSSTSIAPSSAFGKANANFSFGIKSETANQLPVSTQAPTTAFGNTATQSIFRSSVPPTFGKPADAPGGFNFGATSSISTAPVFQFGSATSSDTSSWECSNCRVKNEADKQKCASCEAARPGKSLSGFTFKGANEVKPNASSVKFNAPSTTSAASTAFNFNATAPASTGGFVFGAKSEPATSASSMFSFGSGAAASPKPSITGFESNISSAPAAPFQFGSQNTAGAGPAASTFGSGSNAFTFGAKTEGVNPLQPAVTSQTPAPPFGSTPTQPMFGSNTASPAFGKQAPGGFNFGIPAASNAAPPVFQFGASEKKQATPSGFSFGTPTQDASAFQPAFNMSTPPSFNFGATSAPGPFQFAASSDSSQASSAPRKIRKAVRRMK